MAFTFNSTLKDPDANSYVALASYTVGSVNIIGADDYFGGHPKNDKWTCLSTEQKQQVLERPARTRETATDR